MNKLAVITGGTSGIGLATAKIFLDNAYTCAIVGRSIQRGKKALKLLKSPHAFFYSADVSKVADCYNLRAQILSELGKVNVLVNSAGIYHQGAINSVFSEDFDNVFNTNVKGTFFMCQAFSDSFAKNHAAIVNVSSDAGIKANFNCALYAASKGAIIAFTKSLAIEFAPKNIRVNAVAPGDVQTPMTEKQLKLSGETLDDLSSVYPLKRIATAEEVADAVYFLASEKAGFITGAVLSVDGGLTA